MRSLYDRVRRAINMEGDIVNQLTSLLKTRGMVANQLVKSVLCSWLTSFLIILLRPLFWGDYVATSSCYWWILDAGDLFPFLHAHFFICNDISLSMLRNVITTHTWSACTHAHMICTHWNYQKFNCIGGRVRGQEGEGDKGEWEMERGVRIRGQGWGREGRAGGLNV